MTNKQRSCITVIPKSWYAYIQDNIPNWQYDLPKTQTHDNSHHCHLRKQWTFGRIAMRFLVLAPPDVSIEAVISTFWVNLDRCSRHLTAPGTILLVKMIHFWKKFSCRTFHAQNMEKNARHEPTNVATSLATSLLVIWRFSITIFFIASVFSSVVDVLGNPEFYNNRVRPISGLRPTGVSNEKSLFVIRISGR